MNTVTINRITYTDQETFGTLVATRGKANFTCKTLELPWRNNQKGISCIPKGTYEVRYSYWWSKFRYNYLLQNVKDRSGIFIHHGNYAYKKDGKPDIEGCILLGASYGDVNKDKVLDILSTSVTVKAFEGFMGKQPFTLVIK